MKKLIFDSMNFLNSKLYATLDGVQELLSSDISQSQERLLYQAEYKIRESIMYIDAAISKVEEIKTEQHPELPFTCLTPISKENCLWEFEEGYNEIPCKCKMKKTPINAEQILAYDNTGPIEPEVIKEKKVRKSKSKFIEEKKELDIQQNPIVDEIINEKPDDIKIPTREEILFMAKEFCKEHGTAQPYMDILKSMGCKKLSEVYDRGDETVMSLVNAIKNYKML